MNFVIDTSLLVDHLRGGQKLNQFLAENKDSKLIIPTIVTFELFSGKSTMNPEVIRQITALLENFQKIDMNETIAIRAGKLLRDIGTHIDAIDYIIAASALEERAKVVTLNRKHFEKIPGVDLYTF